jgi:Big-like domain-containing protein
MAEYTGERGADRSIQTNRLPEFLMTFRPFAGLMLILALIPGRAAHAQALPVARPDTFQVSVGTLFQTAAPGLLVNDTQGVADSMEVELVSGPALGAASLAPDGSLWYTPPADFSGVDSLIYRLRAVPTVRLALDSLRSQATLAATLTIPNAGSDDDAVTSRLVGNVRALIQEGAAGLDSVRVEDLDISNLDSLRLKFDYGDFGVVVLTVKLSAGQGAILLGMAKAGPAAAVGFANFFSQVSNELLVGGDVQVSGSGVLGSLVPSGAQQFSTSAMADLSGIVTSGQGRSEISLTLALEETVDLSGNDAVLRINGEVVATGDEPVRGVSNQATVYFEIVSGVGTEPESAPALLTAVYPNPAAGSVRVRSGVRAGWQVEVVDMLGRTRVVGTRHLGPGEAVLDLAGMAPGAYLVVLRADGGRREIRPLIVAR